MNEAKAALRRGKPHGPWRYAGYVILHPFDGFWDLKRERRGSLKTALAIAGMTVLTFVLQRRYSGFIFNTGNLSEANVLLEIAGVLLVFVLWTAANWCLTSLMDGKGTYRDIVTATGYALTPYVVLNLPLLLLSQIMTAEEAAFYYVLAAVSVLWSAALLMIGTMMTHDYSFRKTVLTIVLILAAMVMMLFLGLLLFSILQKMLNLVVSVYREIVFRF